MKYYVLLVAAAVAMAGCKTSESNYRTAYELAVKDRQPVPALDEEPVDDELTEQWAEYVSFTENSGDLANYHTYHVVVAQFKQVFNARSMRGRIAESGYPDAIVINSGVPIYYVVAVSTDTFEQAKQALEKIKNDNGISVRAPYPRILLGR